MKKNYLLITVFLLFLAGSCSKKMILSSSYQSAPLEIDGSPSDWVDTLAYDKDSKVHYRISNDETYIYFLLSTGEPDILRKIRATGFTLWIDPEGKKKQRYGINYPMKNIDGVRQRPGARGNLNRPTPEIRKVMGTNDLIKLTGFDKKGEVVVTGVENAGGINVRATFLDLPQMFYEAKIPIKLIVSSLESFSQDTTNMISLGFETGIEMMSQGNGGRPGMSQGRGGGRPGGSRGGRGGIPQNGQRPGGRPDNVLQHVEYWFPKVRLSR